MNDENSIEMSNFKVSGGLDNDDDEASQRMLPDHPTAIENKLQEMSPLQMKIYDQRTSNKLYINFVIIFILSTIVLLCDFTNTFSCTGDSLTSCYPQFSMKIRNDTTKAVQILNTADECLKMISFFATSFNSNKDTPASGDSDPKIGNPENLGNLGTLNPDLSDMFGSVFNNSEPGTITGPPKPITSADVAELERLKALIDALQMKPPKKRLLFWVEQYKPNTYVHGGFDKKSLGGMDSDVSNDQSNGISEDNAVDLLSMLDLIHQSQLELNNSNSSNSINQSESGIQHFMNGILTNVNTVLESKGLLDVIDTFATSNLFEFNHNGYCRLNKAKKVKFCTNSKGLDIFSVLIQDIGHQLASLVQSNDPNKLSESMLTTYSSILVAFNNLNEKVSSNEKDFAEIDRDTLKSVKSLKNSKSFSKFSARCSWFTILISILITTLAGNILLSFTIENVKLYELIQINLHQYLLKILLGLISIKLMIEFVLILGEFYAFRRYTRVFSKMEIAKLSCSWGFYFTILIIATSFFQLFLIHRMIAKFDQYLR